MELHIAYRWNVIFFGDKRWLKMFLYGSKYYKTKELRQIEKIKDVLVVK